MRSQISRFPGPQISKFPEIRLGPGLGRAGPGLSLGPDGPFRPGAGALGWAVWAPLVGLFICSVFSFASDGPPGRDRHQGGGQGAPGQASGWADGRHGGEMGR